MCLGAKPDRLSYMAIAFHSRFAPKNLPADWREVSLHRAAMQLNRDTDIPAVFPQDSLDCLWELAHSLPRRGILYITTAREFVYQLAIATLPGCDAADVSELRDVRQRKMFAVANGDFDAATELLHRERELQAQVAKIAPHRVTRSEIMEALVWDGVDP
jgi:hypothetical protein